MDGPRHAHGVWPATVARPRDRANTGEMPSSTARVEDRTFVPLAERMSILSYIHGTLLSPRQPPPPREPPAAPPALSPRVRGCIGIAAIAPRPSPRAHARPRSGRTAPTGGAGTNMRRQMEVRESSCANRGRDAGLPNRGRFNALIEAPEDTGRVLDTRQLWVEAKARPVHLEDLELADAARRRAGLPADLAPGETEVRAVAAGELHPRSQYGLLRPISPSRWRVHPAGGFWVRDADPDLQLAPFLRGGL